MSGYGTAFNSLDIKDKCAGIILPSSCVPYEGNVLLNIPKDQLCRPSLNEIFYSLDKILYDIKVSADMSKINGNGLAGVAVNLFELERMKLYELLNLMLQEHKTFREQIESLKLNNIMDMSINIDLSCLGSAQCQNRTEYKFGEVLQILIAHACNS